MKKDVKWSISGTFYSIKNVPFEVVGNEECLDLATAIKVTALRDLMVMDEIPHEIDFNVCECFEF